MTGPLSVSRLETLLESAELLHSSLDAQDLARHLLRSAMGRLVTSRGIVTECAEGGERVIVARGVKGFGPGAAFDQEAARAAGLSLMIPIGERARPVGTLVLGLPASGTVDPEEEEFLCVLAGVAASGIANARAHAQVRRLNTKLDLKLQQLQTLLELVRALAEAEEPDDVARLLGLTLAGQWAVSRSAVLAARVGHPPVDWQKNVTLAWAPAWRDELSRLEEAVRVEAMADGPLRQALAAQRLEVAFPLRTTSTFGLAAVGKRPRGAGYSDADLDFGTGVVAQAAAAFEHAWHLRELLEKKQLERELALAASIQQTLFPSVLPRLAGCDLAAVNRPARQVGGDYYDALTLGASGPGERCLLCVADVSGKGIAASLLMSNMQATLRALLGREPSLSELARCTNELLFVNTPGNKYVTAILLAVEPESGACACVNAGHTEGLMLRATGEVEWLAPTGFALGMFPGARYEERQLTLASGDVVVLYSDGVTEALDARDDEFGADRLVGVARRAAGGSARDLLAAILDEVGLFTAGAPQYDDITLLVLKRR